MSLTQTGKSVIQTDEYSIQPEKSPVGGGSFRQTVNHAFLMTPNNLKTPIRNDAKNLTSRNFNIAMTKDG